MKLDKLYFHKTKFYLLILVILLIPTFWTMIKPGIWSTQDFHLFRLFEFEKCVKDLQIPCRFSPDIAFGYGEPVFNYYGQLGYAFGEVFRSLGFSFINSIKILFGLSLILSGVTMFFASRKIWSSNLAGLVSAIIYVYAPYRAVDVFVRGALPESLAFIFFPLIILFFYQYLIDKNLKNLVLFGLSFSALILVHNLSALMFLPLFTILAIFLIINKNAWNLLPKIIGMAILVFGLTAFYVLPVIWESGFVTLEKTTQGYFDFRNHFVTLYQLLLSRTWGYGGSTWGDQDNLSLSVGFIQWIVPIIIIPLVILKRKIREYQIFFILFFIGWFMLLLTHNKSTLIWTSLKPMAYIQFPWRFLGVAVLSFALASGAIVTFFRKKIQFIIVTLLIFLPIAFNSTYFFEDLWFNISDKDQFSGARYLEQTAASINDYWPVFGKNTPIKSVTNDLIFVDGTGSGKLTERRSNALNTSVNVNSDKALVEVPATYFPGWTAYVKGQRIATKPGGDFGLISVELNKGTQDVNFKFENTPIRTIGDIISLVSIGIYLLLLGWLLKKKVLNIK